MKIIALGNAPSSGSTLLADLLDSTELTAVGPELNLFSLKQLYFDFDYFKKNIFKSSKISSIYLNRVSLIKNDLCAYGLDEDRLLQLLAKSDSFEEFFSIFAESFLALRGKNIDGIIFEKTPQNIVNISRYLKKFNSFFIHIIRNPIDVYLSLLKRGIPKSLALLTWFFEEAHIIPFLKNSNVIIVKYEDLVIKPYEIISNILDKILNIKIAPKEIEKNYKCNLYRKYHSKRVSSWNIKSVGEIKKVSYNLTTEQIKELSNIWNLKISENYSSYYNIKPYTFTEILKFLGYYDYFLEKIGPEGTKGKKFNKFKIDVKSKKFLIHKLLSDIKYRDSSLKDFKAYTNIIECVNK